MRKQRLSLLLAGLVIVALMGGLAWLVFRNQEPVYQGKPLSYWLAGFTAQITYGRLSTNGSTTPTRDQANEAVRQIGTNGIPTLLRMLRQHDSDFGLKLVKLAQKQRLIQINFVPATRRNSEAALAFGVLGAAGSNAVPALIQIYEERISDASQMSTAWSLGWIGPTAAAAVPALVRTASNTNANAYVRGFAAEALGYIHAEPESVVPTLIISLKDSEPFVREHAAEALGSFGTDAKAAIPALVGSMNDPNPAVRMSAESALKAIDPEAAARAGTQLTTSKSGWCLTIRS